MMRMRMCFSALILTALTSIAVYGLFADDQKGRKVALLVAVQDYTGTDLSNLKYTENDIHELGKVLVSQGYKQDDIVILTVTQAFDKKKEGLFPSAENIRVALHGLVEDLREEDTFLVAFSGHGLHLKQLKEKGLHFCPKGTRLDKPETMVSLTEVYEQLEKHCKASVKVLVVDACRNDPSDGKGDADSRVESLTRPVIPEPPGGTVAFFSCSTGQKSYESDNLKHGIFFYHFIQGLKGGPIGDRIDRKGEVTIPLLEDFLTRAVPAAVKKDKDDFRIRQVPERKGSLRGQAILAHFSADGEQHTSRRVSKYPPDYNTLISPFSREEIEAVREYYTNNGIPTIYETKCGIKLLYIPRGQFKMGRSEPIDSLLKLFPGETAGTFESELLAHDVEIKKGFYCSSKEVTIGQFREFVRATGYQTDQEKRNTTTNPTGAASASDDTSWSNPGVESRTEEHPVTHVTHNDATEFCKWLSDKEGKIFRLPREVEWEYACKAGTNTRYWTGDNPESLAMGANVPDYSVRKKAFTDFESGKSKTFGAASEGYVSICFNKDNIHEKKAWRNFDARRDYDLEFTGNATSAGFKYSRDSNRQTNLIRIRNGLNYSIYVKSNSADNEYASIEPDASLEFKFTSLGVTGAIYSNDGNPDLATAGSYKANAFGLHDMHGNVWEWMLEPVEIKGSNQYILKGGCFL